jgi:hypothetical protein
MWVARWTRLLTVFEQCYLGVFFRQLGFNHFIIQEETFFSQILQKKNLTS